MRPRGFGEILDVGLKTYGRHWRTLTACALVAAVLPQTVAALATLALVPDQLELGGEPAPLDSRDPEFVAAGGALQLMQMLTYVLAVAACCFAIGDAGERRTPSARRSLGALARRLPDVIGLYVVMAVGLLLAFALLVLPSVWLATMWSLAVPAMVFGRLGPAKALGRSYGLVRGRFWAMLLLLVVSVLALVIVQVVFTAVLGGLVSVVASDGAGPGAVVALAAGVLANGVTMPVLAAIVAGVYFDRGPHEAPAEAPPAVPAGDTEPAAPSGWKPPVAPKWPPPGP